MKLEVPKIIKNISTALMLALAASLNLPSSTLAQSEKVQTVQTLDDVEKILQEKNGQIDEIIVKKIGKKYVEITERDFAILEKSLDQEEKKRLYELLRETGNLENYLSELKLIK